MSKTSSSKPKLSVVGSADINDVGARPGELHGDVCQKCFGTGMEIIPGKGARQCECQKQISRADPFDKVRVPRRYANCHFNSYEAITSRQKSALRYAQNFAHEFPATNQGILFMGPVGIGKTHLAVSILKGITERGFSSLFYDFGSLLKEIQESYNPNTQTSELGVLSPVLNVDVLVLDELGATKPTHWVRDTVSHIINTRYNDSRTTIFTTNFLDTRKDEKAEILEDRIGTSMRSRLYEMCRTVDLDGDDYRKKKYS